MTDKSSYSVVSITNMIRVFDTLEIPREISVPILKEIKKWELKSGPEWTVDRLKSIKQLYLQHYAGNVEFRLPRHKGVCCRHGVPVGPFKALWTVGFAYKTVNKMMTVLQSYTAFIWLGTPTSKQLTKFLSAVRSPKPSGEIPLWDLDAALRCSITSLWNNARYDRVDHWVSSPNKFVTTFQPSKDGQGRMKTVSEVTLTVSDHWQDFVLACGSTLLKSKRFVAVCKNAKIAKSVLDVRSAFGTLANNHKHLLVMKKHNYSLLIKDAQNGPIVGAIGFIQERGMKLRAVANPLRMIQVALSKLKNWLLEVSRAIPWDCTFDQSRGVRWAQNMLDSGYQLHAFDISNASDTIPLADQIALLKYLAPNSSHPMYEEYMASTDLFVEVARGRWILKKPAGRWEYLTWSKGQPLGLGPSFCLFSLAHGLRLYMLSVSLGLDPNNSFVVLGDDVIVTDALAKAYAHFLDSVWGCDVSVEKTICSSHLTEFASRLVTRDGLVRSWKFPKTHRSLFTTHNPLDLLWRYGEKAIGLVPAHLREKVKLLSSLPEPKGLGLVWDEDMSIRGSIYEEMLSPERREPIPDVAYTSMERKKLANYASCIIRDKPYIERKRELSVCFRAIGSSYAKLSPYGLEPRSTHFRADGDTDVGVARSQLQWLVLHSNQNLDNPDYTFHDSVMEIISQYPRVSSERDSRPEVANKPTPTRLSSFNRALKTAVMAAFSYTVSFISFMKFTFTNKDKDD